MMCDICDRIDPRDEIALPAEPMGWECERLFAYLDRCSSMHLSSPDETRQAIGAELQDRLCAISESTARGDELRAMVRAARAWYAEEMGW